jgi:acyl-coenzyme A thioesterase PaaI-like protein
MTTTNDTGATLALRTVAMPAFTNVHGDIFGGWLLSQMDLAAVAQLPPVGRRGEFTVAVTGMSFQQPVRVGDEVTCYADVVTLLDCGQNQCFFSPPVYRGRYQGDRGTFHLCGSRCGGKI